jgi:VWFA-related protein
VNSRLTLVDVVVRSGNGVVPGLTKANFRLTENGVPQQIASVEEHTGAASTSAAPVPKLPPNTYTNYAPPGQTGVCVVLLDALNTPQKDQMYARQQLLAYLKDLPPGTSTAVFALGSQLRLLQPFSADPAALLAAINSPRANLSVSPVLEDSSTAPEKASDSAQDNVDSRPPQTAQQAAEQGTPDLVANLRQFEAEQDTFNYEFRVRVTMSALAEIAAYVHSQPGRKSLVWISGSFPSSILPNQELGTAAFNATSNLSPLIQRTTAMLTNARISVYPIDARGLMTSSTYDAGSRQGSRYASPHQATALQNADAQFGAKQASEHSAMSAVAEQTGGRAFFNTNGIRQAIAEAATEGERYYTVAYVPTDKNYDNTVRHVAIKVVPGNYQLSYRKSYIAGDPRAESLAQGFGTLDSLHAAFESGAPGSSEILFDISIVRKNATPGAAPAGKVVDWSGKVDRYALDYAIDGKDLHPEMLGGGKAHLDLDIVAIAYDDLGRAVNTMSQVLTADLSPQQTANLQHGALPFHQEIDLPRKTVFLRVGVAEKASGRTGSLEITLPPAK